MTPILLAIIAGLLFLNAWQAYTHERTMLRLSGQWRALEPRPPTEPVPLLVPARAGWGTLLDDIAPTKLFRPGKLPSFTIQEFGGAVGVSLDMDRDAWYNSRS